LQPQAPAQTQLLILRLQHPALQLPEVLREPLARRGLPELEVL
jgi:hypothetical protein